MRDVPARIQTQDPSFVRDTHSKALLNTDLAALHRHRKARERKVNVDHMMQEVVRVAQENAELKQKLADIESKLDLLLAKL